MPGYDVAHWSAFLAVAVLLNLSPGPDMAYVLGRALEGGRRAGTAAMLGVWSGALVHVALAAAGLSAVVAASAVAFSLLKWAGAAYLVWIGLRSLRARDAAGGGATGGGGPAAASPGAADADVDAEAASRSALRSVYRQGVLVDLLNPKVAVFFVAFLPQFAVEGAGPMWAQLALHGVLVVAVGALVEVPLVLVADRVSRGLRSRRQARWLDRAMGAAMVGLGLKLAATAR